jgi:FPC/CPF motif-containing protein YcgG
MATWRIVRKATNGMIYMTRRADLTTRQNVPARDLSDFIGSPAFPCVGAKSVAALGTLETFEGGAFGCPKNTSAIHSQLSQFGDTLEDSDGPLRSFGCVFDNARIMSEIDFEQALWRHLTWLHVEDVRRGIGWADGCSANPYSAEFGMSIAGHGYFIIGLHPGASRAARRFDRIAIIFNSQSQFTSLRADGRYATMQSIIRERERALDGDINPMLGENGQTAQAPQYSGRLVEADWECPFSQVAIDDY